ncbi:MAG: 30S ribosomal protein S20 [Verrucomicrobia bacterium]|nr:MAG: 30S ribosomal protein S20 [Verrucomicrobiota bacterium]
MANIKSSKKDIRRTAARTERNRAARSRIKTLAKAANAAKDAESVKTASARLFSALDKGVKSGIVHKNKVARIKSRMANAAKKLSAQA